MCTPFACLSLSFAHLVSELMMIELEAAARAHVITGCWRMQHNKCVV